MKDNTGYVFEKDGKWYARITLTDSTGRRRNLKRVAASKAEAKQTLRALIKQLGARKDAETINSLTMTFAALCDYYETNYAKAAKFENDQKTEGLRDFQRVRSFIKVFRAHFGNKRLLEFTYDDLRAYRTKRSKVPTKTGGARSVTTLNRELTYLRRILNVGLRRGWLERNPFNCGEPLILTSGERKRERILTREEETRLLAACDHPYRRHLKPFLIALLDTGARKGEMLSLTWGDVDFTNNVMNIRALNTKTLRGRQVPITNRLKVLLLDMFETSDSNQDSPLFKIKDNVRRSFSTACKLAGIVEGGIDGLTLHCLRHTAATRLVRGQLPIQLVGRILGHTQAQTTYRYISVDRNTLRDARNIFENMTAI